VLATAPSGTNIQGIANTLGDSLTKAGYQDRLYWFGFLDGFAVATAPEKVDSTGRPLFKNRPERRFGREFDFGPDADDPIGDKLAWWISRPFFSNPGKYQFFLFTFASGNSPDSNDAPKILEAFSPATAGGAVAHHVPQMDENPIVDEHNLNGWIYVYDQRDVSSEAKFISIDGQLTDRLRFAGIKI